MSDDRKKEIVTPDGKSNQDNLYEEAQDVHEKLRAFGIAILQAKSLSHSIQPDNLQKLSNLEQEINNIAAEILPALVMISKIKLIPEHSEALSKEMEGIKRWIEKLQSRQNDIQKHIDNHPDKPSIHESKRREAPPPPPDFELLPPPPPLPAPAAAVAASSEELEDKKERKIPDIRQAAIPFDKIMGDKHLLSKIQAIAGPHTIIRAASVSKSWRRDWINASRVKIEGSSKIEDLSEIKVSSVHGKGPRIQMMDQREELRMQMHVHGKGELTATCCTKTDLAAFMLSSPTTYGLTPHDILKIALHHQELITNKRLEALQQLSAEERLQLIKSCLPSAFKHFLNHKLHAGFSEEQTKQLIEYFISFSKGFLLVLDSEELSPLLNKKQLKSICLLCAGWISQTPRIWEKLINHPEITEEALYPLANESPGFALELLRMNKLPKSTPSSYIDGFGLRDERFALAFLDNTEYLSTSNPSRLYQWALGSKVVAEKLLAKNYFSKFNQEQLSDIAMTHEDIALTMMQRGDLRPLIKEDKHWMEIVENHKEVAASALLYMPLSFAEKINNDTLMDVAKMSPLHAYAIFNKFKLREAKEHASSIHFFSSPKLSLTLWKKIFILSESQVSQMIPSALAARFSSVQLLDIAKKNPEAIKPMLADPICAKGLGGAFWVQECLKKEDIAARQELAEDILDKGKEFLTPGEKTILIGLIPTQAASIPVASASAPQMQQMV